MGEYKIFFKEPVEKDLRSIPKKDIKKILTCIEALAKDPRPPGHEKLSSQEKLSSPAKNAARITRINKAAS